MSLSTYQDKIALLLKLDIDQSLSTTSNMMCRMQFVWLYLLYYSSKVHWLSHKCAGMSFISSSAAIRSQVQSMAFSEWSGEFALIAFM